MPAASGHIFSHHLLQAQHAAPVVRGGEREMWPSVFLLVCLGLLVVVKARFFSKAFKIVQSTFSLSALQQLEREELSPFRLYSLLLNLLFILNVAFLLYKLNALHQYMFTQLPDVFQFLVFFGLTLLVAGFKAVANRLLGYFTNERRVISEYVVNSLFINQTFGILLFPCMVVVQLSTLNPVIFIWCGLLVLALSVVLKWYRGVMIGLVEERIGLLQIFSYFCSLEILPVFILAKYVIETF